MTIARSYIADEPALALREELCPAPRPTGYIPALDAVRGLAILMVTAFRFFPQYDDPSLAGRTLTRACELGVRGVDLFFVLSGFLITGILWDAKSEPHYFRNFYARRALRIFPLYYGTLLLTLVILPAMGWATASAFAEGREFSPWLWLYGTNVLIASKGDWCFGAFNHFWSLAVEEQFYLVWPLVIFACSRATAITVCKWAIVLSVAARVAWLCSGGSDTAAEVFTLFRLDALAMGGLLALIARGPNGLEKLRPWAKYCFLAVILAMLPPVSVSMRLPMLRETMYAFLFGSLIVVAVTSRATGQWARFWNARPLRFFGKYSYGMYVVQNLLKAIFPPPVLVATIAASMGSVFCERCSYLVLMSLATVVAALLTWHLIEKHFLRIKSRFQSTGVTEPKVKTRNLTASPVAVHEF